MVGICSYGAYVPFYRLSRAEICRAWSWGPMPGEKSVANFDEDSVTMAVAACMDCIKGFDRRDISSVYFASTTFPYKEKQSAAIISTALDLGGGIFTLDLANSLRSGASGVRLARDEVAAKSIRKTLVCAADVRLAYPNGTREMELGDGAAALLVGDTDVVATIDNIYSGSQEILDIWRAEEDKFLRAWEDRFIREKGYTKVITETVSEAMRKYGATPKDFAKAVLCVSNPSVLNGIARTLGFDLKTQVQPSLYDAVGDTGSALSMMMLIAALEDAKPSDRLLWASYGDGCDVYFLTVTEHINKVKNRRGVKLHLANKQYLPTYERYLRWREIIATEPPARPPLGVPSAVALWRDKGGLALRGVKCKECGMPQYPAQRVCISCQAKDKFEDYSFAERLGKIVTFSHDNLGTSLDPPSTVVAVDFEGGGRLMCDMTDRDPTAVKIGMPVEMTFRKVRYVGGIHDYWWKCRPVRA